MCFNATTSAITFSIAIISSIYLYYRGYKINDKSAKFYSFLGILIGLMQLIEYFLWENQTIDTWKPDLNKFPETKYYKKAIKSNRKPFYIKLKKL